MPLDASALPRRAPARRRRGTPARPSPASDPHQHRPLRLAGFSMRRHSWYVLCPPYPRPSPPPRPRRAGRRGRRDLSVGEQLARPSLELPASAVGAHHADGVERLARVRDALGRAALDAVVCTLPTNVLLLSGYWPVVG